MPVHSRIISLKLKLNENQLVTSILLLTFLDIFFFFQFTDQYEIFKQYLDYNIK